MPERTQLEAVIADAMIGHETFENVFSVLECECGWRQKTLAITLDWRQHVAEQIAAAVVEQIGPPF